MAGSKRRLLDVVDGNREGIISFLQHLVRTPSITGQEGTCAEFISQRLRGMGLEVKWHEAEKGRPNVVAVLRRGEGGPRILLNDHMDVVPPGPLEEWERDPFSGDIENGKLYGRGAVDSKSGLATMIMAVDSLLASDVPWNGEIVLSAVVDEEKGGEKGICHLIREGILKRADMGLVLEPTTMRIEIAQKGAFWARITTFGRASHGARPWLGINAVDQMMALLGELKALESSLQIKTHPLLHPPTINVGTIRGGTVVNMVPSQCTIEVDRRLLPGESEQDARAEFDSLITRVTSQRGIKASWEPIRHWPSMEIPQEENVVQGLCRAYFEVLGNRPQIAGKDACTDASWIFHGLGTPVAIFSPGDGFSALTANENVDIEALVAAVKVVAVFLLDQTGIEEKESGKMVATS